MNTKNLMAVIIFLVCFQALASGRVDLYKIQKGDTLNFSSNIELQCLDNEDIPTYLDVVYNTDLNNQCIKLKGKKALVTSVTKKNTGIIGLRTVVFNINLGLLESDKPQITLKVRQNFDDGSLELEDMVLATNFSSKESKLIDEHFGVGQFKSMDAAIKSIEKSRRLNGLGKIQFLDSEEKTMWYKDYKIIGVSKKIRSDYPMFNEIFDNEQVVLTVIEKVDYRQYNGGISYRVIKVVLSNYGNEKVNKIRTALNQGMPLNITVRSKSKSTENSFSLYRTLFGIGVDNVRNTTFENL